MSACHWKKGDPITFSELNGRYDQPRRVWHCTSHQMWEHIAEGQTPGEYYHDNKRNAQSQPPPMPPNLEADVHAFVEIQAAEVKLNWLLAGATKNPPSVDVMTRNLVMQAVTLLGEAKRTINTRREQARPLTKIRL